MAVRNRQAWHGFERVRKTIHVVQAVLLPRRRMRRGTSPEYAVMEIRPSWRYSRAMKPANPPPPAPQHLQEILELEQLDLNLFRSQVNQVNRNRSLFGGQILGQGLKAAALTVDAARQAHSLHGYFLLAGMS